MGVSSRDHKWPLHALLTGYKGANFLVTIRIPATKDSQVASRLPTGSTPDRLVVSQLVAELLFCDWELETKGTVSAGKGPVVISDVTSLRSENWDRSGSHEPEVR